jgi:hypothetical protein
LDAKAAWHTWAYRVFDVLHSETIRACNAAWHELDNDHCTGGNNNDRHQDHHLKQSTIYLSNNLTFVQRAAHMGCEILDMVEAAGGVVHGMHVLTWWLGTEPKLAIGIYQGLSFAHTSKCPFSTKLGSMATK